MKIPWSSDSVSTDDLISWRDATIDWVNEFRKRLGVPPLNYLVVGVPADPATCPVARSIRRGCEKKYRVSVFPHAMVIYPAGSISPKDDLTIELPHYVSCYVKAFDWEVYETLGVDPFGSNK